MKVKICGIMDTETGVEAARLGADAIGFVFADSKRRVQVTKAKEIVANLPKEVFKVGVFVNESVEVIERIAKEVGLTHIQLHGDEPAGLSKSLSLPVIKAVSFIDNESLSGYYSYPCEYLLLDSPKGKYRGGNGTVFDWNQVDTSRLQGKKIILAGGLHPDNVERAIQTIKPYMVDVSSGVETNGQKDLKKVQEFIEKAKGTYRGKKNDYLYTTE